MYKAPQPRKKYRCTVLEPKKSQFRQKSEQEDKLPQQIQEEIEYISVGKPKKNSKFLPGERLLRNLYKERKRQIEIDEQTDDVINNSVENIFNLF